MKRKSDSITSKEDTASLGLASDDSVEESPPPAKRRKNNYWIQYLKSDEYTGSGNFQDSKKDYREWRTQNGLSPLSSKAKEMEEKRENERKDLGLEESEEFWFGIYPEKEMKENLSSLYEVGSESFRRIRLNDYEKDTTTGRWRKKRGKYGISKKVRPSYKQVKKYEHKKFESAISEGKVYSLYKIWKLEEVDGIKHDCRSCFRVGTFDVVKLEHEISDYLEYTSSKNLIDVEVKDWGEGVDLICAIEGTDTTRFQQLFHNQYYPSLSTKPLRVYEYRNNDDVNGPGILFDLTKVLKEKFGVSENVAIHIGSDVNVNSSEGRSETNEKPIVDGKFVMLGDGQGKLTWYICPFQYSRNQIVSLPLLMTKKNEFIAPHYAAIRRNVVISECHKQVLELEEQRIMSRFRGLGGDTKSVRSEIMTMAASTWWPVITARIFYDEMGVFAMKNHYLLLSDRRNAYFNLAERFKILVEEEMRKIETYNNNLVRGRKKKVSKKFITTEKQKLEKEFLSMKGMIVVYCGTKYDPSNIIRFKKAMSMLLFIKSAKELRKSLLEYVAKVDYFVFFRGVPTPTMLISNDPSNLRNQIRVVDLTFHFEYPRCGAKVFYQGTEVLGKDNKVWERTGYVCVSGNGVTEFGRPIGEEEFVSKNGSTYLKVSHSCTVEEFLKGGTVTDVFSYVCDFSYLDEDLIRYPAVLHSHQNNGIGVSEIVVEDLQDTKFKDSPSFGKLLGVMTTPSIKSSEVKEEVLKLPCTDLPPIHRSCVTSYSRLVYLNLRKRLSKEQVFMQKILSYVFFFTSTFIVFSKYDFIIRQYVTLSLRPREEVEEEKKIEEKEKKKITKYEKEIEKIRETEGLTFYREEMIERSFIMCYSKLARIAKCSEIMSGCDGLSFRYPKLNVLRLSLREPSILFKRIYETGEWKKTTAPDVSLFSSLLLYFRNNRRTIWVVDKEMNLIWAPIQEVPSTNATDGSGGSREICHSDLLGATLDYGEARMGGFIQLIEFEPTQFGVVLDCNSKFVDDRSGRYRELRDSKSGWMSLLGSLIIDTLMKDERMIFLLLHDCLVKREVDFRILIPEVMKKKKFIMDKTEEKDDELENVDNVDILKFLDYTQNNEKKVLDMLKLDGDFIFSALYYEQVQSIPMFFEHVTERYEENGVEWFEGLDLGNEERSESEPIKHMDVYKKRTNRRKGFWVSLFTSVMMSLGKITKNNSRTKPLPKVTFKNIIICSSICYSCPTFLYNGKRFFEDIDGCEVFTNRSNDLIFQFKEEYEYDILCFDPKCSKEHTLDDTRLSNHVDRKTFIIIPSTKTGQTKWKQEVMKLVAKKRLLRGRKYKKNKLSWGDPESIFPEEEVEMEMDE